MPTKTDFRAFFEGLSDKQRVRLAREAETTVQYIEVHLLGGRRVPRVTLLEGLIAGAAKVGGRYNKQELMACFLKAHEARAAT